MPVENQEDTPTTEYEQTDWASGVESTGATSSASEANETDSAVHPIWQLVGSELPLQNATTIFILINTFDIFMTYVLMRFGAIEVNPVANYFMDRWGFSGLILLKLSVVAFVCVLAQIIALKKRGTARGLLIAGSTLVGLVVVYSVALFAKHYI